VISLGLEGKGQEVDVPGDIAEVDIAILQVTILRYYRSRVFSGSRGPYACTLRS
jgi:hypothetical protein